MAGKSVFTHRKADAPIVALLSSGNNMRLANNKADDLSIKKLAKNALSVKAMFDELKWNQ